MFMFGNNDSGGGNGGSGDGDGKVGNVGGNIIGNIGNKEEEGGGQHSLFATTSGTTTSATTTSGSTTTTNICKIRTRMSYLQSRSSTTSTGTGTNLEPWSLAQLESLFQSQSESQQSTEQGQQQNDNGNSGNNKSNNNSSNSRNKTNNNNERERRSTTISRNNKKMRTNHHRDDDEDDDDNDSVEDRFVMSTLRSSLVDATTNPATATTSPTHPATTTTMYDQHRANFDKYGVSTTIPDESPQEIEMWMNEMDFYLAKLANGQSIGVNLFGNIINNNNSNSNFVGAPVAAAYGGGTNAGGHNNNKNSPSATNTSNKKSIRTALGHAMSNNLEYVQSLRMSFLRSEDWNTKRASRRMYRYFDQKLTYFGPPSTNSRNNNNRDRDNNNNNNNNSRRRTSLTHNFAPPPPPQPTDDHHDNVDKNDEDSYYYSILTRPITISDLTDDEINIWKRTGVMQWLPERDLAGRPVQIIFGQQQYMIPERTIIRLSFVLVESMMLSLAVAGNHHQNAQDVQKSGAVQIYYGMEQSEFDNRRANRILHSWSALPIRCVARHYIYDDKWMYKLYTAGHKIMDPFRRLRLVPHFVTTHEECCYNLMTYGIRAECIPAKSTSSSRTTAAGTKTTSSSSSSSTSSITQLPLTNNNKTNQGTRMMKKKPEKFIIETDFNEGMIDALLREEESIRNHHHRHLQQHSIHMTSIQSSDSDIQGIVEMLLGNDDDDGGHEVVVPTIGDSNNNNGGSSGGRDPGRRDSRLSVNLGSSFWKAIGLGGFGGDDHREDGNKDKVSATGFDAVAPTDETLHMQQHQQNQQQQGVNMSGVGVGMAGTAMMGMGLEMPAPPPIARPVQPGKIPLEIGSRRRGSSIIIVPGPDDVIMGRGRHNKNKPGNRKLQNLLLEHLQQYEEADKYQKTKIAETVLQRMVDTGSRFLVREQQQAVGDGGGDNDTKPNAKSTNKRQTKKGIWVEVTPEKARDKIAHDFRNLRSAAAASAAAAPTNGTIPR